MNIISINPEIYTIDNFLSEDECNHFINISKDKMKRSVVTGVNQGILSAGRTGSNTWIPHNYDSITYKVACNIAKLIGIEISNAEAYQVIHYKEGEEYKQHYDSFTHEKTAKNIRCMKLGGQRMKTALCYLNNVEEGGSTQFTKINENIYPKIGKMLVFSNVNKNTNKRHVLSEHAAMPVLKGEKWAFNLWFREFNRNTEFDLSTYAEENIPSNINDTLSDSKLDSKLDPILIPKDLIIDKTINKKIDNNNSKKYSFSVLSNENEIFIIII